MPSFPHRMVAVVARLVLAIVEDLPAAVADIACLVAAAVSLWPLHRLIVHTAAWVGEHVAAHRKREEQHAFDEIVSHLGDVFSAAPPPVRREIRRRRMAGVRIPGRHVRHTTSSDRRTRS